MRNINAVLVFAVLLVLASQGCSRQNKPAAKQESTTERPEPTQAVVPPEIPPGKTVDIVRNGDFSEGLAQWSVNKTDKGVNTVEVVELEGGIRCLHVKRTDAGGSGTYSGVFQELNLPLAGVRKLVLRARLQPVSHSLPGTGYYGGEAPIVIRLRVKDSSFPKGLKLWEEGLYLHGDNQYSHMHSASAKTWVDFERDLADAFPSTATIHAIQVIGSGWDFEGYADDVQLLVSK